MLTYESYFLITLISILGPVLGVVGLFFYNVFEKQIYLLQIENRRVSLEKELEVRKYLQLSQQIQPHFLFNALNSLFSLLRLGEYEKLSKSFEHLIMYLRSLYDERESIFYHISDEVAHTQNYLEIQKLRFGERLEILWWHDKGLENYYIIQYLLITIVENSFKHGLENVEGNFSISIRLRRKGDNKLELIVKDSGPGFSNNPFRDTKGVGLKNVKNQLDYLFHSEAKIDVNYGSPNDEGAIVSVTMPLIKDLREIQK